MLGVGIDGVIAAFDQGRCNAAAFLSVARNGAAGNGLSLFKDNP